MTSLEVVEHVAEPAAFVARLAAAVAEDGLLILSTPNRTAWSRLAMITLGEGMGRIPKGTHDWDKFVNPDELCALVRGAGLEVVGRDRARLVADAGVPAHRGHVAQLSGDGETRLNTALRRDSPRLIQFSG